MLQNECPVATSGQDNLVTHLPPQITAVPLTRLPSGRASPICSSSLRTVDLRMKNSFKKLPQNLQAKNAKGMAHAPAATCEERENMMDEYAWRHEVFQLCLRAFQPP